MRSSAPPCSTPRLRSSLTATVGTGLSATPRKYIHWNDWKLMRHTHYCIPIKLISTKNAFSDNPMRIFDVIQLFAIFNIKMFLLCYVRFSVVESIMFLFTLINCRCFWYRKLMDIFQESYTVYNEKTCLKTTDPRPLITLIEICQPE